MIKTEIKIDRINSLNELKSIMPKIRIILFGETHGFFNELPVQEEIIKAVNPEYYIWEMIEDKELLSQLDFDQFLEQSDNKDFSLISTYGELKPTVRLTHNYNLKVIGCDLRNMGRKDKAFLSKINLTIEEEKFEEDLLEKRERRQAEVIKTILKKTNRILFVSVGAYHIRKNSYLFKYLEGINFIVCYPTLKGKQEFGPQEDITEKDVSYIIQLKEDYFK